MQNSPAADSIEYSGEYPHGVDSSRRVMMPKAWRPRKKGVVFALLAWPLDTQQYIKVLPPERYAQMMQNLRKPSMGNEAAASLKRVIISSTWKLELDRFGRLCLPEALTRVTNIDRQAVFLGVGDMFEIWAPERRTQTVQKDVAIAAEAVKHFDL